jgi:Thoeris protein ThsB, TIR-like domain
MKPRYVDVFISHKSDDAEKAKQLKAHIVDRFQMSCFIDADDEELKRIQQAKPVDYKKLTDRIRENLRTCRCLIFAYSTKSRDSRWMPWELGFFDGRWGKRLIGLYDLDEGAAEKPAQSGGEPGVLEFEQCYMELTPATLESFLQYARSPRALSDRADVDTDRWTNLVAGILRDPVNASIDATQYWIAYQQALWSRAVPGLELGKPLLAATEVMRTALGPLGKMTPPGLVNAFDAWIQRQAVASQQAEDTSRGPVPNRPVDLARPLGMQQVELDGLDGFIKLVRDANTDALKYGR